MKSSSFTEAPCRIAASGGPLWSSTITSWIIVSSRCVFGSSNGTRQFSASSTVNSPAASSAAPGPPAGASISASAVLPVCTLSESTAVMIAASESTA